MPGSGAIIPSKDDGRLAELVKFLDAEKAVKDSKTFTLNERSPDVKKLQVALNVVARIQGRPTVPEDGLYGPGTAKALAQFNAATADASKPAPTPPATSPPATTSASGAAPAAERKVAEAAAQLKKLAAPPAGANLPPPK